MNISEYAKTNNMAGRMKAVQARGASRLRPAMEKMLLTAAFVNHRQQAGEGGPLAMSNRERKLKLTFLRRLRRGLEDLRYLAEPFASSSPLPKGARMWFQREDVLEVLDKDAILNLIQMCLRLVPDPREYADAILDELASLYSPKGEDIVIIRGLQPRLGLPEHRRSFTSR